MSKSIQINVRNVILAKNKDDALTQKLSSSFDLSEKTTHRSAENCGEEQNEYNSHFHCVTVWCLDGKKKRNTQVEVTQ